MPVQYTLPLVPTIDRRCEYCGAAFVPRGHSGRGRFCSKGHAIAARNRARAAAPQEKPCAWCGEPFRADSNKRLRSQRFCGRACVARSREAAPRNPLSALRQKQAAIACGVVQRALRHKGVQKDDRLVALLGYTPRELAAHLEARWLPGMSWENYGRGGWHVDHIRPVSSFPVDTAVAEISALANLQPLWEIDNLRKGRKFVAPAGLADEGGTDADADL